MRFDGSSIEGFTRIAESDQYLMPDMGTFAEIPWQRGDGPRGTARVISVSRAIVRAAAGRTTIRQHYHGDECGIVLAISAHRRAPVKAPPRPPPPPRGKPGG